MVQGELEATLQRLREHYQAARRLKFQGLLPHRYHIVFNPHLRRLTGRITYSLELIEISTYHFRQYGYDDAVATLEHEMLHLYLHRLGMPSGHTLPFKRLARTLGIRVFHQNPYPKNRTLRHRYLYECPSCARLVFRRAHRAKAALACGVCCRAHARGAWDARFQLTLIERVKMG
jgi:predicted SprT family Zn-dependent metalloprotease